MQTIALSAAEAFRLIASATFHPFGESDWYSFSGCKTENPMIAETDQYLIILDGDEATFGTDEGDWIDFKLNFVKSY